jgi:hypothetical protein
VATLLPLDNQECGWDFWHSEPADGFWNEERYTAAGFPLVLYLRYHGYPEFPRSSGALPQSQERQCARGCVGDVTVTLASASRR